MADWFGMVFVVILIPVIMIICGKHYTNKAPKTINHFVGYRTERSMKNNETWKFAHKNIGSIWYKWGLILLPISVLVLFFVIGKDEDTIGILGTIITIVQLLPILVSILLTEKALKDNFDKEGNRKNGKS